MRKLYNYLMHSILLLFSCVLIGTLLIIAVYCIPTEAMWSNVEDSLQVLEREGQYYQLFETWNSCLDNFTDAFMIGNTITTRGKGIIDDAMSNYRTSGNGLTNIQSLRAYVENEPIGFWSYGRYWHGYLVLLKPLFMTFNYSQIRYINSILQISLVVAICVVLSKRKMTWLCMPIIVVWYLLCPPAVMMSLQFSSVFYISFGACLLVLLFHDRLDKLRYPYLFMMVGAATSYFDMLTYPTMTFLFPVTMVVLLRRDRKQKPLEPLVNLIGYGFTWAIGFLFMWFGKWCVATILTGTDYISQSLSQVLMRTSTVASNGESIALTEGLVRSVNTLLTYPTPIILFGALCVCILITVIHRNSLSWSIDRIYPYALIACVPIVWLLLTCNHSTIHHWFTYRNLVASVFAVFAGILSQCKCERRRETHV